MCFFNALIIQGMAWPCNSDPSQENHGKPCASGDLLYPQQRTTWEDLNGPNGPNTESLCKAKQPTLQTNSIPMYCLSFRQLQVDFNPIRMVDTLFGTWVSAGRFSFVAAQPNDPMVLICLQHSKNPLWFVEVIVVEVIPRLFFSEDMSPLSSSVFQVLWNPNSKTDRVRAGIDFLELASSCNWHQVLPCFRLVRSPSFSMVNPVNPVNSMRNLSSDQIHSANNPQMLQSFFVTFKWANDPHVIGQNDDPPAGLLGVPSPSFGCNHPKNESERHEKAQFTVIL